VGFPSWSILKDDFCFANYDSDTRTAVLLLAVVFTLETLSHFSFSSTTSIVFTEKVPRFAEIVSHAKLFREWTSRAVRTVYFQNLNGIRLAY